jgi:hypothetical protein
MNQLVKTYCQRFCSSLQEVGRRTPIRIKQQCLNGTSHFRYYNTNHANEPKTPTPLDPPIFSSKGDNDAASTNTNDGEKVAPLKQSEESLQETKYKELHVTTKHTCPLLVHTCMHELFCIEILLVSTG